MHADSRFCPAKKSAHWPKLFDYEMSTRTLSGQFFTAQYIAVHGPDDKNKNIRWGMLGDIHWDIRWDFLWDKLNALGYALRHAWDMPRAMETWCFSQHALRHALRHVLRQVLRHFETCQFFEACFETLACFETWCFKTWCFETFFETYFGTCFGTCFDTC